MVIIGTIRPGDLLNAREGYICHQLNCLTVRGQGLSKAIADRYGHGDHYSKRTAIGGRNLAIPESRDVPGTVAVISGTPNILCIFGQWAPGSVHSRYIGGYPRYQETIETAKDREGWFQKALRIIDALDLGEIAIPVKIGCGLAGGHWPTYKTMLEAAKSKFVVYDPDNRHQK